MSDLIASTFPRNKVFFGVQVYETVTQDSLEELTSRCD
jgi:hypothetical protein